MFRRLDDSSDDEGQQRRGSLAWEQYLNIVHTETFCRKQT